MSEIGLIIDGRTGEVNSAQIFVAVLGTSNYRAGAENSNNAISENLLPFKVREDIRMEQKNEKKSKKKSLTGI